MSTAVGLLHSERENDIEVIERARGGSPAAFDVIYESHNQFIYNVCYRILGSSEDAVDATQETFILAYRRLRTFRGDADFRTWLYRIATNVAIGMARKRSRGRAPVCREPEPSAGCSAGDLVWEAILELPPEIRVVLVLFYFHDLSCEELAKALGCSKGAARVRLHRARKSFKQKYQEMAR